MTESLTDRIEEILTRALPESSLSGYTVRPRQLDMALTVADAVETGGLFVLEAGTGVGKSLAYLVPALLSGAKTVVSTATLTLQDQLVSKDVPSLTEALGIDIRIAVLKGRRDYLCLRTWSLSSARFGGFSGLGEWAESTDTGDVSHSPSSIPSDIWRHVSGDRLDCPGSSCPFFRKCFYYTARNAARRADLLILNHHLLISGLQTEDLIPEADLLVIDEGHRLEDAASECMGISLGEGMLFPLFDGVGFCELEVKRKALLLEKVRGLAAAVVGLTHGNDETARWSTTDNLVELNRVARLAGELRKEMEPIGNLAAAAMVAGFVEETVKALQNIPVDDYCTFVEVSGRRKVVRSVPLEVGRELASVVYSAFPSVILTSATLTVDGSFEFFTERLGTWDSYSHSFGSPFDYSGQAILSVPEQLPRHDSHGELASAAWSWAKELSAVLHGRTMMLFTSYRNLTLVKDLAAVDLPAGLRLFVQGDMPRKKILEEFRKDSRGIILGTTSFWEGIDLPGDLLQAVIIDRIPFPSPGQPLTAARLEAIERRGESSFRTLTLPAAAVRLKQGVGRLIRSATDRGIVLILDHRLKSAGYGSVILRSLPSFRSVPDSEVVEFAMEHCGDQRCITIETKDGP